jgi:glycosyltransferase involved in cell wall biosynthesis
MASGLPIVLAASGEAASIVESAHAGIAVNPGDPHAIADAVKRISTNSALHAEYAARGREAAISLYDRGRITDGFIDFLESDLEHGRSWSPAPSPFSKAAAKGGRSG